MRFTLLLLLAVTAACSEETVEPASSAPRYNIDTSRMSVSGVSAGAYMAGQMHVAYSALFSGAGLVAGGPYYCAMGELTRGLGPCMQGGELGEGELLEYAQTADESGLIDDLENLQGDRVWVFHGSLDTVVKVEPSLAAIEFYTQLAGGDAVTFVSGVEAVHGLPTIDQGPPCDEFATPYLNACDYDAAGEMLNGLHGDLNPRAVPAGELAPVPQPGFNEADMLENAFLYVPAACTDRGACGVHVAFHGCLQSSEYIDDAFASGAGINEWAESNNLLVLYPQVASSKFAPMNPNGCWDWWGYTGEDYATRNGAQLKVVKATLDALAGREL